MSLKFVALLAVFLLCAAITPSSASAASTVAVINIQKIMREATAAQAIRTQLQNKQKAFQSELDARESALQKEDQELAKQRSVLSQEAFEAKYTEFRNKAAGVQKEVREKRTKLDKGFTEALSQIQKKVTEIVAGIAAQKGIDVTLSTSQLIYANPSLEITDEVLKSLNAQMPSVTVNFN